MNLIEQAAKRLEDLQRSGAELPGAVNANNAASDEVPTPEAAVRALESRDRAGLALAPGGQSHPQPHPGPASLTNATLTRGLSPDDSTVAATNLRRVDLNLSALAARGFVSPEAPSQIVDEFRVVKRPIIRNALGRSATRVKNGNLIMVTSALPGEGKTFTSVNLALSIALEIDSTVLLVDGDVAHPQFPELLGVPRGPGLLDLLTRDDMAVGDTLVRTNVAKLTIMPAGSRHPRATELLASEQMAGLLRELGARYHDRIIIFDSPPLLATTEARVMASHMGQIVMVVSADHTTQHAVKTALTTIESCEVVLMMLNKASRTDVGTYYGYYGDADKG